jgi:hypothetical protein
MPAAEPDGYRHWKGLSVETADLSLSSVIQERFTALHQPDVCSNTICCVRARLVTVDVDVHVCYKLQFETQKAN